MRTKTGRLWTPIVNSLSKWIWISSNVAVKDETHFTKQSRHSKTEVANFFKNVTKNFMKMLMHRCIECCVQLELDYYKIPRFSQVQEQLSAIAATVHVTNHKIGLNGLSGRQPCGVFELLVRHICPRNENFDWCNKSTFVKLAEVIRTVKLERMC